MPRMIIILVIIPSVVCSVTLKRTHLVVLVTIIIVRRIIFALDCYT